MSVPSRDPLAHAAAALQASEGLATKPCEACFAAGREMAPPEVYVARRVGGEHDGDCFVTYQCPTCGHADAFPIPPHLLLAVDLRADAAARVDETRAALFYSIEGEPGAEKLLSVWIDPADGQPPIKVTWGYLRLSTPTARVKAAIDFIAGGDGERAAPELPENDGRALLG